MRPHLVPCPVCSCHVRVSEFRCPFCESALPDSMRGAPPPPLVSSRLGRAQKFAFRVALASAAVTACGGSTDTDTGQTRPNDPAPAPSPDPSAPSTATAGTAETPTAQPDDTTPPPPADDGGMVTDPPPDNGIDAGGPVPIYSASPAD